MLGEMIGELKGKRIVRRTLSVEPVTMEVNFEDAGTMFGVKVMGQGTYTAVLQPTGTTIGEGQGVTMTEDGEVITWKGSGLGTVKQDGALSYRGILYYRTASQKLARLNTTAAVFEYEVAADGNTNAKLWEWK